MNGCSGSQTNITKELLEGHLLVIQGPCYLLLCLSLRSLQKGVHCTFSNKKLTSDSELEIYHHFMKLEEALISTAVILGTLAGLKLIELKEHDKSR